VSSRLRTKLQENILKPLAHGPSLRMLSGSGTGMRTRPILVIIITNHLVVRFITYFERVLECLLIRPGCLMT
jgi:hypothetical protein